MHLSFKFQLHNKLVALVVGRARGAAPGAAPQGQLVARSVNRSEAEAAALCAAAGAGMVEAGTACCAWHHAYCNVLYASCAVCFGS
jgi:hypothetical protein